MNKPNEKLPLLYQAAALIREEHANMIDSTFQSTLTHLWDIADELERIEDSF
jgi:hypothetical protein